MIFNQTQWHKRVLEVLPTVVQRFRPQPKEPLIIYSTVAGLTLWPLVEAATQTKQFWSLVRTLYTVADGEGSDVLAAQLQEWHEQGKVVEAPMVMQWVRQETAVNPPLHTTLNTILKHFNAFHLAQHNLPEAERRWFATTLQTELTSLGSWPHFAASLAGFTEMARATTVGTSAVNLANSTVHGNIITGNIYNGPTTTDPATALNIYRRVLVQCNQYLPLQGIDMDASDPTKGQQPLGLAHIYVALDTTTQIPLKQIVAYQDQKDTEEIIETIPLSALAAVTQQRLILLGDPGSGKSTFVKHLAHCLAAHALWPQANWLSQLPDWPITDTQLLPLVVILRDLAQGLPTPLPQEATAHHLWAFIKRRLAAQNLTFVSDALNHALENGRVLLLLDGLDEIASPAKRLFVRQVVQAFVIDRYPRNRVVITCRVLSYQPPTHPDKPDLRLPTRDFPIFELAPFNKEKIDKFIDTWYAELVRQGHIGTDDQTRLAPRLQTAVRQPDLWRLASNPLLLTVMALVHTHEGRLPDARALLYEKTIEMLLWRWEAGKADTPALRQLLRVADRADMDLKRLLWRLAYEAHSQMTSRSNQDTLADIEELHLRKALLTLKPDDWGWVEQMLTTMKLRAGLLLERAPGYFTFPHRTFQEYLAGAYLASQGNFAQEAARLGSEGTLWREVILLAIGRLVHLSGDIDKPLALVNRLCPRHIQDTTTTWYQAWLAGDVLLACGLKRIQEDGWGQELLERVQQRLVTLITQGHLPVRERAETGSTLAYLGDPRPGVCTLEPDMIPIPAGTFLMGREKYPIILEAFAIARYPVTNAQYRFFVADGGYTQKWRPCWTDEGWSYRKRNDWKKPRYWHDVNLNQANQPVVGISWYEATAYVNWLSQYTGRAYRLPTEAQWERAARYTDGRLYPWGEAWQLEAANSEEVGIERLTAVGLFTTGATVERIMDISGNVWEWCQTRYWDKKRKEYPIPYREDDGREQLPGHVVRVRRGGSYRNTYRMLRCAVRGRSLPLDVFRNVGFRCVLSPFFTADR